MDLRNIEPRFQILYLLGVAILAFATVDPGWLLGLLGLQVALWLTLGLPLQGLFRIVRKLSIFFLFIIASYAFFEAEPGDRILPLALFGWAIPSIRPASPGASSSPVGSSR